MGRLRREWISIVAVILSLATALYYYPRLPAHVPTHWGPSGAADSYSSPGWAAFFPVVMTTALAALFTLLPSMQPGGGRLLSRWRAYNFVRGGVLLFLWWVQLLTMRSALSADHRLDGGLLTGGIGVLLIVIGAAVREVPSPPRTVRIGRPLSEDAQRKAHRFMGTALIGAGVLTAALSVVTPPKIMLLVVLGSVMAAAVGSVIYAISLERSERTGK